MPREECARKTALREEFQTAMDALIEIQGDEVAALLKDDFDQIAELKIRLQAARERKASLIELYREHVISHGC